MVQSASVHVLRTFLWALVLCSQTAQKNVYRLDWSGGGTARRSLVETRGPAKLPSHAHCQSRPVTLAGFSDSVTYYHEAR